MMTTTISTINTISTISAINTVSPEQALQIENTLFLDTRSPAEFAEDHLPSAVNMPILSNEERAVIGTIYKQVSQQHALEQGKQYFQEKVPAFLNEMEKYRDRVIIVNCWRGGMRSASARCCSMRAGWRRNSGSAASM